VNIALNMRTWKPIIACVLVVMMVLSLVTPTTAAAESTVSPNSAALQQSELYTALIDEYGEEEALTMLRMMQQLGAVNEKGEVETFPIQLNDRQYSLQQIYLLLEDENTDLAQVATVDGDEITLEQLKKLLEIEQSIGHILNELEQDQVQITDQHLGSIESIYDQALADGVQTFDEHGNRIVYDMEGKLVGVLNQGDQQSNEDYEDIVEVSLTSISGTTFQFKLNRAQTELVSFDFEVINGSQKFALADGGSKGTVTFNPGETTAQAVIPMAYRGQTSVKTNDWNLFQSNVFHGVSQADLVHFYNFKNFDRFKYNTAMTDKDAGVYYSYNGGAYAAIARRNGIAGFLEIANIRGKDELNKYYYQNFYDKANVSDIDRLEANSGKYKTGQLLPINVYFNRPFEIGSEYQVYQHTTLDLKNGQKAYALVKNGRPTEQQYATGALLYGFASPIDKQTTKDFLLNPLIYDGLQVTKVKNISPLRDWNFWRDADFYGTPYPNPFTMRYPNSYDLGDRAANNPFYANNPDIILVPNRADIFTGLSIDKNLYYVGDKLKVDVLLEDTEGFYEWLVNGAITPADIKKRVYVSIGDRDNGMIELDWKRDAGGEPVTPLTLTGELEINDETFELLSTAHADNGYLRAKIFYNNGSELNSANIGLREDMAMLNDTFQYFRIVEPLYITEHNASIIYPTTWPSGIEKEVNLISPTATKLAYQVPAEATFQTPDQFEWRSSDASVATILADGTIVPKQTGTVTFQLIAKNDGRLNPQTVITSDSIEIVDNGSAAIIIPDFANQIIAYHEQDAVMYWSTNVMSRYKKLAQGGTPPQKANFKVELFAGNYDEAALNSQTPLHTWSAPQSATLVDATSFVIPGQYLTELSVGNAPTYTLRVSTKNPENELNILSATTHVIVRSPAVKVEIDRSAGQAFTDDRGSIPISWTMSNFDGFAGSEFEFEVTRNGELLQGSQIRYDADSGQFTSGSVTKTNGDFVLQLAAVHANEQRFKDNYIVTIKAKNSSDSTWSYDSYYLYVYDADALEIWVDGQQENAVTLSNIDRISNMTSEQILALNRDITLVKNTNMNYSRFKDLNLISDQIAWEVDNSYFAALNYGTYGNLASTEEYGYDSYIPTSKFQLTGLETGQTKVTATHARTGMAVNLDVTVETLRDKLYLFQFYPKVESTINYYTMENGAEVEREVKTNANGELALYEENGIVSDVYITSYHDGSTYTGVIDQQALKSKEQNPATRQLYPVNILQLRRLAEVDVYLKKPDGKPYTGEITYRGGVYRNGKYAKPAEIGVDTSYTVGNDGRLKVIFDTTDFYDPTHENNASSISAKDEIEIILEIQFAGDAFFPVMVYSSGNATPVDMIEFGDKNQYLRANASGTRSTFIYSQFVNTSSSYTRIDMLNYRGKFGPNNQFSSINLTTEFMWWGEAFVNDTVKVELLNELGTIPDGQSYETMKYPFSDYYTTRHVQLLNASTIWLDKSESGSYSHRLYDDQGQFLKSFNGQATLVNMIGVPGVDIYGLKNEVSRIRNDMANTAMGTPSPSNNDKIMLETLKLLGNFDLSVGPMSMKLYPTDDPMVYKTIMSVYKSTVPSATRSDAGGNASVSFFQNNKQSFAPGAGDMKSMALGSYAAEQRSAYNNAKADQGFSSKGPLFTAGGYYIGELRYNTQTAKWDNIVQAGGFTAGGGFEYSQSWNMMAGFVPVTFSITIGAAVEVGFQTSVLYEQINGYPWSDPGLTSVNDYLTSLRIVAYAEAFAGVGFDLSVIAFKIGFFGRLTFDNTTQWLNRGYLANSSDRVLSGDKLSLEGIVGIRAMFKFLFISVTYDLASFKYNRTWLFKNWNKIEQYWKEHSQQPLTAANAPTAISMYLQSIGQPELEVLEGMTVESRDYLTAYDRTWNNGNRSAPLLRRSLATSAATSSITTLQTNAYPFSNPIVANDGSLFVYQSDAGSAAVEDTVISWAKLNSAAGQYEDQGAIITDAALRGYGDSSLQVDGERDFVAAVWVTQEQPLEKEAGEDITNEEILLMNNSTEVMAAIYDGQSWTSYPLTANATPDLAPLVAVSDDKVMVAYRSVYSHNVDNPLDFSQYDSIMYRVYDRATKAWSDPDVLYNGTNGTIMGMSATALSDGTTAIAFAVNAGGQQDAKDNEIIYMVIDTNEDAAASATSWKAKGLVKSVQLTSDQWADENPQMTAVRWTDGSERFVLAWYKTSETAFGSKVNDIPLAAIKADGELEPNFVDSLSDLKVSMNEDIDPSFVFAKMADDVNAIDNLSLVWKTSETNTDEVSGETIQRDRLRAVKFGVSGTQFYLSAAQDIGTAEDFTQLDHLSVYVSGADGRQVKGVLLGTTYTTDAFEAGSITTSEGEEVPVYVSQTVSNLYTSTGYYKNAFNGGQVYLNPEEIVRNFDLPIEFTIVNEGIDTIHEVTIEVNGVSKTYPVQIVPNRTEHVVFSYSIPDAIGNIDFTVTAAFSNGDRLLEDGRIKLDIADIGMSDASMTAENGIRKLMIPLYNKNDASLAGNKGKIVKVGLYENALFTDAYAIGTPLTIADELSLDMMDNGGYTARLDFDVKAYLEAQGKSEIPDEGLYVYLHAWIEDENGKVLAEFDDTNNFQSVFVERLAVKYDKPFVRMETEQDNTGTESVVSFSIQNMNMAPLSNGNVVMFLVDEHGEVLESQYLRNSSNLLQLGAEKVVAHTFRFTKKGYDVRAEFYQESTNSYTSELSLVSMSGVPLDFNANTLEYHVDAKGLDSTQLIVTAKNPGASLTVWGPDGQMINNQIGRVMGTFDLASSAGGSDNEFTFIVTPKEKAPGYPSSTIYKVIVNNTSKGANKLTVAVTGTNAIKENVFWDDAAIHISPYALDGYRIQKVQYNINNQGWIDALNAYDGLQQTEVVQLTAPNQYDVRVRVVLENGKALEVDRLSFSIEDPALDPVKSTIEANSFQSLADGQTPVKLNVMLRNANGYPLAGRTVEVTNTAGVATAITAVQPVTDAEGKAIFDVNATTIGSATIEAKEAGGVALAATKVLSFNAGGANASRTTVEVETGVYADGADEAEVVITVRDAGDHTLANIPYQLWCEVCPGTITPSYLTGKTDEKGKIIASFTSTEAGAPFRFVAQIGSSINFEKRFAVTFIAGPADGSKMNIELTQANTNTNVIANGTDSRTVRVTLRDASNRPVANRSISLTTDKQGVTISPETNKTNISGEAYFTVKGTSIGEAVLTATESELNFSKTLTLNFVAGQIDTNQTEATISKTTLIAGSAETATITAYIRDASGYPIVNKTVNLQTRDGLSNGIIGTESKTTGADGKVEFVVPARAYGSVRLLLYMDNAQSPFKTFDLMNDYGPASDDTVSVWLDKTQLINSGSDMATLTVEVRDELNHYVAGKEVLVSTDSPHISFNASSGYTDKFGRIIFAVKPKSVGTADIKITLKDSDVKLTRTVTVVPAPISNNRAQITASLDKTEVLGDGVDQALLTITAKDQYGNPFSGADIDAAAYGNDYPATQIPLIGKTDENGTAVFPIKYLGALKFSIIGDISYDGGRVALPRTAELTFVQGEADLLNAEVSVDKASFKVGERPKLTIVLKAENGLPYVPKPGEWYLFEISGTVGDGEEPFEQIFYPDWGNPNKSYELWITKLGKAELSVYLKEMNANTRTKLADLPSLTFETGSFEGNAYLDSVPSVNDTPASLQQDYWVDLRAVTTDIGGNPVAGRTISLHAMAWDETLQQYVADSKTTIERTGASATDADGVMTFRMKRNEPGAIQVQMVDEELERVVGYGYYHNFSEQVFDPERSRIEVDYVERLADGNESSLITVHMVGTDGEPMVGAHLDYYGFGVQNVQVEKLDWQDGSDADGVYRFKVTSQQPANVVMYFADTYRQIITRDSVVLRFVTPEKKLDVTQSSVEAIEAAVVADGKAYGVIEVHVVDHTNTPIPYRSIQLVPLGGSSNIDVEVIETDADGMAWFMVSNEEIEEVAYKVVDVASNLELDEQASLMFVAGDLDVAQSTVTSSHTERLANGVEKAMIEASLRDSNNHPLVSRQVRLEAVGGQAAIAPQLAVTNAAGVAGFEVASEDVGSIIYSIVDVATGLTLSDQITIDYVTGEPDAQRSTVAVHPQVVVADGASPAVITITVKDAYGHAIEGLDVRLVANGGNSTITALNPVTDAMGAATFEVYNDEVGEIVYTAYAERTDGTEVALDQRAVVTFVNGDIDVYLSGVAAAPSTVLADGVSTIAVTATLVVKNGLAVSNRALTLYIDDAADDRTWQATTNADGIATFELQSTAVEELTLYVQDDLTSLTLMQQAQVSFTAGKADAAASTIVVTPASVHANGAMPATITVTAKDAYQHVLSSQNVSLWLDGSMLGQSITDTQGTASFTVTGHVVEERSYEVYMTIDGAEELLGEAVVKFVNGSIDVAASSIATDAQAPIVADNTTTAAITVTAIDEYGHVMANREIELIEQVTDRRWLAQTDANGKADFLVKGTALGQRTYRAYDAQQGAEIQGSVSVTYVAGTPSASASTVHAAPNQVIANGRDLAKVTVTISDDYGHLLPNQTVSLRALNGSAQVNEADLVTNAAGQVVFTLVNNQVETVELEVVVAAGATTVILDNKATVKFVSASTTTPVGPTPTDPKPSTPEPNESDDDSEGLFNSDIIDLEKVVARFRKQLAATAGQTGVEGYSDIKGHWALKPIGLFSRLGGIRGYQNGTVRGNATMTRAEFAAMLVQLLEIENTGKKAWTLSDIESNWASRAIATLAGHGIINGYVDGTFRPNQTISRQEMVTMLLRLVRAEALPKLHEAAFVDGSTVSLFAVKPVQLAAEAGIIQGYTDGTFRPQQEVSRAEAVVMTLNLLQLERQLHVLLDPELKK